MKAHIVVWQIVCFASTRTGDDRTVDCARYRSDVSEEQLLRSHAFCIDPAAQATRAVIARRKKVRGGRLEDFGQPILPDQISYRFLTIKVQNDTQKQ